MTERRFDPNDSVLWITAFLTASLPRCRRLARASGLPVAFRRRSKPLEAIAERLVTGDRSLRALNAVDAAATFVGLLEEAFATVDAEYGEDQARQLYGWMWRCFINQEQISCWRSWEAVIPVLLSSFERGGIEFGSTAERSRRRLGRSLRQFLSTSQEAWSQLEAEMQRASNLPTADPERQLLSGEGEVRGIPSWEPGELVRSVALAVWHLRIAKFWARIDRWATESERQELFRLAKIQADIAGLGGTSRRLCLPERTIKV